jgi:cytochrome c551/c552
VTAEICEQGLADKVAFFESKVRPVLVERCVACHGPEKQKAGLRLDSLVGLLRGGESGAAIDLDNADASNLVAAIRHESWEMPPDGKLPDDQIEAIVSWVKDGAAWTGSKPAAELLAAGLPEVDDAETEVSGPKKRSKKGGISAEDRG